jgi:hypothetical protein
MQTSEAQAGGFRERAKVWISVAGMFLWGTGIACFFGAWLLDKRAPGSPWGMPLLAAFLVFGVLPTWLRSREKGEKADGAGCLLGIYLCLCLIPLLFFSQHIWAAPVAGAVTGAWFWALGRSRRRSWPIAVMGCLVAGAAALQIPWPNEQRLLLVLVCFGLAGALQGAWKIVGYLQGQRPEPAPQEGGSGLAWLLFGRIEHVQITSPALEQRIRTRYQEATAELARLGFAYLCSYGETFSVFRLLLGIPAIAILSLLPKRPVVGLWGGLRIGECCPLLIAGDRGAYADADFEGVKFYTAFTDGTFLVSANYKTLTLEGPVMTRRWRAASIGEAWGEHQAAVQAFEAAGRRVDRRSSFQEFADLLQRDHASF